MRGEVFKYLRLNFTTEPETVDRLIVSSFLKVNSLKVEQNSFLKSYIIDDNNSSSESNLLASFLSLVKVEIADFDFETLIEFFEFVVSPADKIVNGAIYTPKFIREYIVNESLSKSSREYKDIKACDISCGCGGFLLTLAHELKSRSGRNLYDIFKENIYGIDITDYSITRAKLLLSLYAIVCGEDTDFEFNLKVGNSLVFDWRQELVEIKENNGFDIIVGNPPYVSSRNMDESTLRLMSEWKVTASGHPDLYIPFFQIGYECLNDEGILGLITVNTFIKSINGRALRQYFADNNIDLTIVNFGGEQLFKDRNTYTCVCFLTRTDSRIKYIRTSSNKLLLIQKDDFQCYDYQALNHFEGWNLVNTHALNEFIALVESTGTPFNERYVTRNGIATLKNDIYKFQPVQEDEQFYYLKDNEEIFPIEKSICKDIVNANKLKSEQDLVLKREKVIFPYERLNGEVTIINEGNLLSEFPNTYKYLLTKKDILAKRDKGKRVYEAWYAYGRKQSLGISAYKLFFPHICERPSFVVSNDKDLLYYNGIAVVSDNLDELILLKKLLESDVFYHYIKSTTKDYSSGYISLSKNYLKNFGVYNFGKAEHMQLLNCEDPNSYIAELYKVSSIIDRSEERSLEVQIIN